jgi:hypothetical protein
MTWEKKVPRLNITGERYNHLVAIEPMHASVNGGWYWRFRCDCGKETVARAKDVRLGTTTSCGCQRGAPGKSRGNTRSHTEVVTGSVFGHLTVTKSAPKRGDGFRRFHCHCDCGARTIVRANLLTTGQTKSCGCLAGRPKRRA